MVAQGQFTIADLHDGTGAGDDVIFYLATDKATGVTVEDPGWTRTPQDMTPEKPYLWTYRLTAYSLPGEEPTEELTGNPVTITNLGDPVPLAGLAAAIAPPARDYHGYDAPWAPGMGKNRIDPDATDAGNGYVAGRYLNAAGTLRTAGSGAAHWHVTEYIPVEPDTVYTLSGLIKAGNSTAPALCRYDANKAYLSGTAYNHRDNVTITTEPECAFVRLSLYDDDEQVQLEAGESATDYAPWANICPLTLRGGCAVTVTTEGGESTALSVTWQDAAGVIYAGTLDVTSGVLTVTQGGMVFDGTEAWDTRQPSSTGDPFFRLIVPGKIRLASGHYGCSHFPNKYITTGNKVVGYYAYTSSSQTDGWILVRPQNPGDWTETSWKAWLAAQAAAGTPVSAFWLWTEPKVYQLGSQEVRVLAGSTTVSCDTGPVTVSRWTDPHATAPVLTGVYGRDGVGIQTITPEYRLSISESELRGDGAWTDVADATTATVSVTITDAELHRDYRCVITDKNGLQVKTRAVRVREPSGSSLRIVDQPQDFTGAMGVASSFTVVAEGDGLEYQWQVQNPGSNWGHSTATGNKTATLSAGVISAVRLTRLYRCIITNSAGETITTDEVKMVLASEAVTIQQQPHDVVGSLGGTATFEVTAAGDTLTYQWQSCAESEWSENYPTSIPEGTWLWQRTRLDYDDGSAPTYTVPVCVSQGMVTQEQLLREVTQLSSRLEVAEKGITLEALEQTLSTYLDTLNNVRNELQTLGYSLQLTAREGFVIRSVTGLDAEEKPVYGEVETVFTNKAWLMRKRSTREVLQQVHADTGATFSQLTLAALNAGETATMALGNLLLVVGDDGSLTGRAK